MRSARIIAALALTAFTQASVAQTNADGNARDSEDRTQPLAHERVVELIELLGASDWATRQRAEQFLLLTPNSELKFIQTHLNVAEMSPEQRIRLMRVGARIFRRMPHAAMGIQFVSTGVGAPAAIRAPLADFDASRVIRRGDVVTEMEGMPIRNAAELRAAIISCDPDEMIEIEVLRDDRRVRVSFRLGNYGALRNARLSDTDLDAAWAYRLQRAAFTAGGAENARIEAEPIVPPGEAPAQPPARSNSPQTSPNIFQLGAAFAITPGEPLSSAPTSPYRPNSASISRSRRGSPQRRSAEEQRLDDIKLAERKIAKNLADISWHEQRVTAFDRSLQGNPDEAERKRLLARRMEARRNITRLKLDSKGLADDISKLRRRR